jgi:hypothetical protein
MLPEIAAEVLHLLSRRDLDKACAVSKWLDALIAQFCDVYPLRSVDKVQLYPRENDFIEVNFREIEEKTYSFSSVDEAVHIAGSFLRRS